MLWCDGHTDEPEDGGSRKMRKKDGDTSSKRQEREDEVNETFKQLKEMQDMRLRLWARTI